MGYRLRFVAARSGIDLDSRSSADCIAELELVVGLAHNAADYTDIAAAQDIAMHMMVAVAVRCTDLALHPAAAAHFHTASTSAALDTALVHTAPSILHFDLSAAHTDHTDLDCLAAAGRSAGIVSSAETTC